MKLLYYCILLSLSTLSSCIFFRASKTKTQFSIPINKYQDKKFIEPQNSKSFYIHNDSDTARLYYLCKVWGLAKYYHNNRENRAVNVDSILLKVLSEATQTKGKTEYNDLLLKTINTIQFTPIEDKNTSLNIEDYELITNDWLEDSVILEERVTQRLEELFTNYSGWKKSTSNSFVFNREGLGTILLSNEKRYNNIEDENIRLLGLFRYWNIINYFYPLKNFMDESWDKALYESIPIFKDAVTKEKYHKAIYQLTNRLGDTHASFPPSKDTILFGKYRPCFRITNINDTLIINEIRDEKLNNNTFQIGDIVHEVDDMKALELYNTAQTYVCGSTYWSNINFISNAVLSRHEKTTQFTILRGNDTLRLNSINSTARDLFLSKKKREKSNRKKKLYKWLNDSIAYFDLTSATYNNFKKNYTPISGAKSIIIDLRCYPETYLISRLADYLVPPNTTFANITYADADYPGLLRYHKSSKNVGNKDYYKGELFVLINEWTQSYSEYLAMLLQTNPKTVTVGRASSGSNGNVSTLTFPGEIKTLYTGIGIYYPDMTPTQRRGIKIDYPVTLTSSSIKNKTDDILEEAIKLATDEK